MMNTNPKPTSRFSKQKKKECILALKQILDTDGFVYGTFPYLRNDEDIDLLLEYIRSEEDITPEDVILWLLDLKSERAAKE